MHTSPPNTVLIAPASAVLRTNALENVERRPPLLSHHRPCPPSFIAAALLLIPLAGCGTTALPAGNHAAAGPTISDSGAPIEAGNLGVAFRVPDHFALSQKDDGLAIRKQAPPAMGTLSVVPVPCSDDTVEEVFAAMTARYGQRGASIGVKLTPDDSRKPVLLPLGTGWERRGHEEGGARSAFFRVIALPACEGRASFVLSIVWTTAEDELALESWLKSFVKFGSASLCEKAM